MMSNNFQKELRGVVWDGDELMGYDDIVFSIVNEKEDDEDLQQLSLASPTHDFEITIFLNDDLITKILSVLNCDKE